MLPTWISPSSHSPLWKCCSYMFFSRFSPHTTYFLKFSLCFLRFPSFYCVFPLHAYIVLIELYLAFCFLLWNRVYKSLYSSITNFRALGPPTLITLSCIVRTVKICWILTVVCLFPGSSSYLSFLSFPICSDEDNINCANGFESYIRKLKQSSYLRNLYFSWETDWGKNWQYHYKAFI